MLQDPKSEYADKLNEDSILKINETQCMPVLDNSDMAEEKAG
jgi:hypothetical protein